MKAILQRVSSASIRVEGQEIASIGPGILTLIGIQKGDTVKIAEKLIQKIIQFRMFEDDTGKMNRSLLEIEGEHLIVSQFTLCADTEQGRRPSFVNAETPEKANALYEHAIQTSKALGVPTSTGQFQANMQIALVNEGPVTFSFELQAPSPQASL